MKASAIAAAKKAGRIQCNADGLYDAEFAAQDFESSRSHPAGPGRGNTFEAPDDAAAVGATSCPSCGELRNLQYWKTRREKEAFLAARLGRLELQGVLVRRTEADNAEAAIASMMRSFLEGIGPDLRDVLAAEEDAGRCGEIVSSAIREALERAADQIGDGSDLTADEEPV